MILRKSAGLLCGFILAIAANSCTSNAIAIPEDPVATEAVSNINTAIASNSAQPAPIQQVTEAGIGGLTASTPFDVDTIQAIFPEWIVSTTTDSAEGMEYTVIVVSDGNAEIMRIEPTTSEQIYRVNVLSPQVIGPSGHAIGNTFGNIYSRNAPSNCGWVVDSRDNLIACDAPSSQTVRYIFLGTWEERVYDPMPPAAEQNRGFLQSIVWNTQNY